MAIEDKWFGVDLGQFFPKLKEWKDKLQSEHAKLTKKLSTLKTNIDNIQSKLSTAKSVVEDAKKLVNDFADNTTEAGVYILSIEPVKGGNKALKSRLEEALVTGALTGMPQFKDGACMYGFLIVVGSSTFDEARSTYEKLLKQYGVKK